MIEIFFSFEREFFLTEQEIFVVPAKKIQTDMEGPAKKPRVIRPVWPVIVPGLGLFWSLPTPLKQLIFFEYLVPPSKVMLAMTLMQKMPGLRYALKLLRMVGSDSISEYRVQDFHVVDLKLDWLSWCVIQPGNEYRSLNQFGVRELNIYVAIPPFVFRLAAHERSAGETFRIGDFRSIRLFHWSCVPTTTMFLLCAGASGHQTLVTRILDYLKVEIDLHGEDRSSLRQYNDASLMMIRGAMRRSPESVARRTIQAVRTFYNQLGMQMVNYSTCIYECRRLDLMEGYVFNGVECISRLCFGATVSKFACSPMDFCRALREKGALIHPSATLCSLMDENPLDVDTFIEACEFGFPLGAEPYDILKSCMSFDFQPGYRKNWKIGHYVFVQRKYGFRVGIPFFAEIVSYHKSEDREIFEWACAAVPEYSPGLTRDDVACSLFHALLKKREKGVSPETIRFIAFLKSFLPMDNIDSHAIKAMLPGKEESRNRSLREICKALGIKRKYERNKKPENNE